MPKLKNLKNKTITIKESKHIDVNIESNNKLDVNIVDCENLTLRIKNPKSRFIVELNGESYILSEDGKKLEEM